MEEFSRSSDSFIGGEVDLASALRESISFGRFLSESLDWEKWSAFCHNKHLEEAKNCSVPGSVAQKKAYFEAHYKKTASRKLSGLPESENAHENQYRCVEAADGYSGLKASIEVLKDAEGLKTTSSNEESRGMGENDGQEILDEVKREPSMQIKPSNRAQGPVRAAFASQIDLAKVKLQKKEQLKIPHENERQSRKNSVATSSKAVKIHQETRISPSSTPKIRKPMLKENKVPQSHLETGRRSTDRRKVASESQKVSFDLIQSGKNPSLVNKILPIFEKMGDSKATCTSSRASEHTYIRSKTPARASTSAVLKHAISTPQTDHKRTKTPSCEASCARREGDTKLCSLSINCFKSPSASEYRELNAGSASSSFKIKEQTVSEVRKMWQNRCFKARPLPDFYHNSESSKVEINKVPLKKTTSPLIARSNSKLYAETRPLRSSFASSLRSSSPSASCINAMT